MFRGKLKKLFTQEQILQALDMGNKRGARFLTGVSGIKITRQNLEYWRAQHRAAGVRSKIHKLNEAGANRELIKERKIRVPAPSDFQADVTIDDQEYRRMLVIPDLHIPYHHKDALPFLKAVKEALDPDVVVNLGDEVDNHAISFHNSDPNLLSAGNELEAAREVIYELHDLFPTMFICHSNHGSLHYRRAKAHGIPVEYLKTYREILFPDGGGASWDWDYQYILRSPLGPVAFKHQCSGSAVSAAAHEGTNLIVGHNHSLFEVSYKASRQRLYWGATSGCLIDRAGMAFAYGKEIANKPMLGCTVVIEGRPIMVPMVLDINGNWDGRVII